MLGITLKETTVYREIKEEGREEATVQPTIRQLRKLFGELPEDIHSSITGFPLPVLEDLSEALLDFSNLNYLQAWLESHGASRS